MELQNYLLIFVMTWGLLFIAAAKQLGFLAIAASVMILALQVFPAFSACNFMACFAYDSHRERMSRDKKQESTA